MRSSSAVSSPTPLRVLLVDDNAHGLVARRLLLENQGYEVVTACDGVDALGKFEANGPFTMVVTDYRMPRMDGIALIERLRQIQPAARIVLISGFVEALGLTERTTGADCVVAKNAAEVPNLLRAVGRLAGSRNGRKPPQSQRRVAAFAARTS